MRLLLVAAALAVAAPQVCAADKDEDKAKEVSLAFLKAVKAKDLDAVMKTVDTPFLMESQGPIAKPDELKDAMKTFLEKVNPDKVPSEVGTVLDLPALRKKIKEKADEKEVEKIEKILGKTGYVVMLKVDGKERGGLLVQVKDGQAKVVGIPK